MSRICPLQDIGAQAAADPHSQLGMWTKLCLGQGGMRLSDRAALLLTKCIMHGMSASYMAVKSRYLKPADHAGSDSNHALCHAESPLLADA